MEIQKNDFKDDPRDRGPLCSLAVKYSPKRDPLEQARLAAMYDQVDRKKR